MSLLILPLKAANISSMDVCNQLQLKLPTAAKSKIIEALLMLILKMGQ